MDGWDDYQMTDTYNSRFWIGTTYLARVSGYMVLRLRFYRGRGFLEGRGEGFVCCWGDWDFCIPHLYLYLYLYSVFCIYFGWIMLFGFGVGGMGWDGVARWELLRREWAGRQAFFRYLVFDAADVLFYPIIKSNIVVSYLPR